MEQYIEIKAANPDCLLFYRMGDFYELFFDDAEVAARALGIVLTKRGKHLGRDIPMCGVPVERADEYLHRLIAFGHRVAVCEQLEDPAEARKRGNKSVVRRDVVRLVTPGTLTEDLLLDARRNNYLLALARARVSSTKTASRSPGSTSPRASFAWRKATVPVLRPRSPASSRAKSSSPTRFIRRRACAAAARAAGGDAARPRRVRRRDCRAAACRVLRRRHDRGLRRILARRADGRGGGDHLRRAHPDRQASAAVAAGARGRRRDARDRPRDAQQPRARAHACRRTARFAARRDRSHGDAGWFAGCWRSGSPRR